MLPLVVCFKALLIRFDKTCVKRFSSVFIVMARLGFVHSSITVSGQRNLNNCLMPLQKVSRLTGAFLIVISPDSTRDKSRISLMRLIRRLLLLSMISRYFMRSSGESVSAMTREKPSMAFNGVRISWLMLARKRDFILLAFSALDAFSSYSFSFRFAASSCSLAIISFLLASVNFCIKISLSS